MSVWLLLIPQSESLGNVTLSTLLGASVSAIWSFCGCCEFGVDRSNCATSFAVKFRKLHRSFDVEEMTVWRLGMVNENESIFSSDFCDGKLVVVWRRGFTICWWRHVSLLNRIRGPNSFSADDDEFNPSLAGGNMIVEYSGGFWSNDDSTVCVGRGARWRRLLQFGSPKILLIFGKI